MNKKIIPLILAGTAALTACKEGQLSSAGGSSDTLATVVSKEDAIASVNGKYISKKALETLEKEISQRSRGQSFPKEKLVDELVQRELLIQDAVSKQLEKTPDFAEKIATIKKSLLSQAAIQEYLKANPVTDEELKAEYDKNVGKSGEEYKARHILVKTEDEAKKIIAKLAKGADFAKLAEKESTGPSGPKGGDLGWFASGQMVPPFSEAVIALKDKEFTKEPVKTQFGWHVILREEARAQTPPPFETVKEQISPMLQRKKMQTYLDGLRAKAQVDIFAEPAAPATPPTAAPAIQPNATTTAPPTAGQAAGKAVENTGKAVTETANQAKEIVKGKAVEAGSKAVEAGKGALEAVTK